MCAVIMKLRCNLSVQSQANLQSIGHHACMEGPVLKKEGTCLKKEGTCLMIYMEK